MKKNRSTHLPNSGFLFILLLVMAACNTPAEKSSLSILKGDTGDTLESKLTPVIQRMVAAYDLPGIAIGIVKDNEIVYAKAFGYSNMETGESVTICRLCLRIFPDEILNTIKGQAEWFRNNNPDNKSAPAILEVMQAESPGNQ